MEEVNKNIEENINVEETINELHENEEKIEKKTAKQKNYVFLYFAAAYLVYNGYSLCNSYFHDEDGATLPFFLIGVAFIVIAIGICAYAFKNGIKQKKDEKDAVEEKEE